MQYIDNIKNWTTASLEENVKVTEYRIAWRKISYATGAANVRTDDPDYSKEVRLSGKIQDHDQRGSL